MGSIRVDDSRFPLVVATYDGAVTDAEFDEYLKEITEKTFARPTRSVVIVDATRAVRPNPLQRKRQAEWLKTQEAALKKTNLGTAFVISNALIRGGLTAIFWIAPMPTPTTVVATYAQAEEWAFARLREAGIEPPPPRAARSPSAS
jgi:hypothetical protein